MNNLYIIGNGFDLYHGLDTKYQSFAKFLAEEDEEIYDLLLTYYGLPDISQSFIKFLAEEDEENYDLLLNYYGSPNLLEDPVNDVENLEWANFESSLANLDYKQVLEDNSDAAANLSSDDFRDRDLHTYQFEMEMIIDKLTVRLISIFNLFILNINYPERIDNKKIELNSDSIFLNFNYTNTLEKYYNISNSNICYIHKKSIDKNSQIVLGHGTDPSKFEETQRETPKGLSKEELIEWMEHMSEQYDFSYESAKREILSYYTKSFKNVRLIIDDNVDFFLKLNNIKNVYVLGHSISSVDMDYFKTVFANIHQNAVWYVSYYSDFEKENHLKTLLSLGIKNENIKQIRIEDLKHIS